VQLDDVFGSSYVHDQGVKTTGLAQKRVEKAKGEKEIKNRNNESESCGYI
jgi:hypothetical protein